MLLRSLAIVSALVIPALMAVSAVSGVLSSAGLGWLGPALAAACAIPILYHAVDNRSQAVIGAALAAMAAGSSPGVPDMLAMTGDPEALPIHDLRERALPMTRLGSRDYVALRGYLRDAWVVDEYAVNSGERPDQDDRAKAVLLPLLGSEDEVIAEDGLLVVARVSPERLDGPSLQTLRGRLGPVDVDIADSLFTVQGASMAGLEQPPVVLLDTLDQPNRGQALTRAALAIGAALLALALLMTAIPGVGPGNPAASKDEGESA